VPVHATRKSPNSTHRRPKVFLPGELAAYHARRERPRPLKLLAPDRQAMRDEKEQEKTREKCSEKCIDGTMTCCCACYALSLSYCYNEYFRVG
jgi:hypothetical protein